MFFHTFGDSANKILILIHGVLTPWQIWQMQIDFFKENYFIIVPELDAHEEESASEFVSIEEEATTIEEYVLENYGENVFAICGLSMGGAIANIIFGNERLRIEYLIYDGAPLVPMNSFLCRFMTNQYLYIIQKSKERDEKVLKRFKRDFLPEKYLESYLKFADTMSASSMKNIISSVGKSRMKICENINHTKILFLHGTKGNEILAQKSVKLIKKQYPDAREICYKGYKHCELAIYCTEDWISAVNEFISE